MSASNFDIRVECYAGYRDEQEPRRFWIGARPVTVVTVLDRWISPTHRYFKVCGGDDGVYILRHDTPSDRWELSLFEARPI